MKLFKFITLTMIFLFIFLPVENATADVYISGRFYYASGVIVIGGVGIYFIFSSENRGHYSKKVKPPENSIIASFYDSDLEIENNYSDYDNPFQNGLLKIFKW